MDQPVYLRRLLKQKVLLIVGLIVAIIAGLFAGFTVQNGELIPRADRVYTASATVLLSSPQPTYFQVEVPGVQALPQTPEEVAAGQPLIVEESVPIDLAGNAIILAYLASSDQISDDVAAAVDGLNDGEVITAVSRTTQPTGDERFPGRLTLPLLDIGASALSPARAEVLAAEATTAFAAMVTENQDLWGVAEDIRLTTDVLNVPVADEGEGSNPAIPVVVVAVGVFLLFVAAALIIEGVRDRRRAHKRDDSEDESEDDEDEFSGAVTRDPSADEEESEVRSEARRVRSARRRSPVHVAGDDSEGSVGTTLVAESPADASTRD